MNAKQLQKLVWITNRLNFWHHDGNMAFSLEKLPNGELLFSATNIYGLRWFERTEDFYGFIGVRGGVRKYAGNITL